MNASAPDPFVLLGIDRSATLDEARVARRRLAFHTHPDRGGDADEMRAINDAYLAVEAHLTGHVAEPTLSAATAPTAQSAEQTAPTTPTTTSATTTERAQHDAPSFVISALPAESFEALLVVTSWIGEVLVDDPPYLLEVHLYEPSECWCRLELVPDAGACTVSLTVVSVGDKPAPLLDDVRDMWVRHLNMPGAFE